MAGATALRGGDASICSRKPPSQPGQASPASPSVRTNRWRFPSSCQFILFQRGFVLDYFICLVISDKYSQSENDAEPELDPMELYDNEESRSHTVDDSNGKSSMDVDKKQLSVDANMNGKPSLDGDAAFCRLASRSSNCWMFYSLILAHVYSSSSAHEKDTQADGSSMQGPAASFSLPHATLQFYVPIDLLPSSAGMGTAALPEATVSREEAGAVDHDNVPLALSSGIHVDAVAGAQRSMLRPSVGEKVHVQDGRMGRTCVYVHHVDKDAFLKGNIVPDPDELDMVFDLCPSYGELLEQVRKDLNWMDPSDVVEFAGRHNVGFGMHIRWKTMRVNSEQRWLAYKDTVAESLDKALELFAMKTNVPNLLDLNRVASSIVEAIPATINEEANIEPLSCVYEANEEVNIEHEPLVEANYEHYDDGNVLHDNNLGDLDKYNLQETMDHSIPYSRGYASESDDEGPDEEVDEEGFTAKEAEAFTKVLKRDHRTPLFEDLSLADEAVVDGGEGILFGVRPPSHRDTHGKHIILPGSKFKTFFELKMWLDEYSVTHYRPHKVVHSNMKLRYTVACEDRGCPSIVRARPWKGHYLGGSIQGRNPQI
ncbi:hypothetical protein D1007_14213 [Hordeum vulgare]|nr:hypothetical protein D1007_14213 [Hordeum vulgare]